MLLAIDTASQFMSVALHDGRQILFESTWRSANNHTIELTPAIRAALTQTQITPQDLTIVAVSKGPGSFTGLRIGMGVAKGLVMAVGASLVAVPTLEIVAAGVPFFEGRLVAVLQAGRGRVCAQQFEWKRDVWVPTAPAEIASWEKLISAVEEETLFAGEIDDTGRKLLDDTEHPVRIAPGAYSLRRAGYLAEIAWARVDSDEVDDPATVTPIYLHQPGVPHP